MTDEQSEEARQTIEFTYEKGNFFRVIHVDGAYGGLAPDLGIHMAVYSQRRPIPQRHVNVLKAGGELGDEIEREQRPGIFREVEADLVFTLSVAKAMHSWLEEKIQEAERIASDSVEPAKGEKQ